MCFFCLGSFQPLVADVCMQGKFKTYTSFKRLGMVLATYWSFIDLVQLCYITNLSKVGAENDPHRHAGRVSLASTCCLQLSWLYLRTLYTFNKIINCFWFLRINLFLGSTPNKSENQASWDQDCLLISSTADYTAMKLIKQKLELLDKTWIWDHSGVFSVW